MLVDVLSREPGLKVRGTVRDWQTAAALAARAPEVDWAVYDGWRDGAADLAAVIGPARWVLNAIGVIKPHAKDGNAEHIRNAIRINAALPFELAAVAAEKGARILQIATDCVYSGQKGGYLERDPHDALDVYGKTKSLGEAPLEVVHLLRCSIIGPEPKAYASLLEWFRRQPEGAAVKGFVNHHWNGVTTLHFARLCGAVMRTGLALPRLLHVIPGGVISKEALLRAFAAAYGRRDIAIEAVVAATTIDRTLATEDEAANRALWAAAGYPAPPRVERMVEELAAFDYRFDGVA
jgi:dTDP-4-dehydrorhamnose reductase